MASEIETRAAVAEPDRARRAEPSNPIYDRSSLSGDYLVMIAGQTEEDFFRYAPEGRFCEFIDGIVYMPSPVSVLHQELIIFLCCLLDGFRHARNGGMVLTGPAVLRLRAGRDFEPDIFVLRPGAEGQVHENYVDGPAALAIEILSPSNPSHDLVTKAPLYLEDGTGEVWLVDARKRELTVRRRTSEGDQTERIAAGPHRSTALDGFWIDVSWLWADPLPDSRRCLEQILAGPPH